MRQEPEIKIDNDFESEIQPKDDGEDDDNDLQDRGDKRVKNAVIEEFLSNKREQAKQSRRLRKAKRNEEIRQIFESQQNDDEIRQIMSQSDKQEGAFCAILFTACFMLHFFFEIGGVETGSHYQMQSILSEHFENRKINLPEFMISTKDQTTGHVPNDYMTINDIQSVNQLPIFSRFVIDLLYPEDRARSDEDSYFSYDLKDDDQETDPQPVQEGNETEEQEEAYEMTLFNSFNYYCGMQVIITEAKLAKNEYNSSKRVIPEVKPLDFQKSWLSMFETNHISKTHLKYFQGDLKRVDAVKMLNDNIGKWFSKEAEESLINAQFKIAFFNQNDALGVILTYTFSMSNGGVLSLQKDSGIFKPVNYSEGSSSVKWVLLTFWGLLWFVQFMYAVVDLLFRLRRFLLKSQLEMDWFRYFEYFILCMCLIVLITWVQTFPISSIYHQEFVLPMNEDSFNTMVDMTHQIKFYNYYCGIVAICLMTKLLKTLTSKFPAFGVLFETISAAKTDILYFTIITFVMICGFMIASYSLFGSNEELFSELPVALSSMVRMMFGTDMFYELDASNPKFSIIFLITYAIMFYFIIKNVYAAIVMRTYDNLRQKKQLMTEAMADIFEKQAKEFNNKIQNIIFCKMDKWQIDDSDDNSSDSEDFENDLQQAANEDLPLEEVQRRNRIIFEFEKANQEKEDEAGKSRSFDLWGRVMHNWGTVLDLLNPNSNQLSVQAFEIKLKAAKAKIVKKKWQVREARIRKFGGTADKNSFIQLRNMILFFLFIYFNQEMLTRQLKPVESSNLATLTRTSLKEILSFTPYNKYKNLKPNQMDMRTMPHLLWENITEQGDIQDYIVQPIYNFLYERSNYKLDYKANTIVGNLKKNEHKNVTLVDQKARIMINFHSEVQNMDKKTSKMISNRTEIWSTQQVYHLNMSVPEKYGGYGENNKTRTDDFTMDLPSGELEFKYMSNPTKDRFLTDQGDSGYVFDISNDKEKARAFFNKFSEIDFSKKFQRIAQINIDFVIYNVNFDIFQYVQIHFFVNGAGSVSKTIRCTRIENNHFARHNEIDQLDKPKGACLIQELLFLIFVAWEFKKLYNLINDEWNFLSKLEEDEDSNNSERTFMQRLLIQVGTDPDTIHGMNIVVLLVTLIKGLCFKIVAMTLQIIMLFYYLLQKSFFNLVDMTSMALLFTQIGLWAKIISLGEFTFDENTKQPVDAISVSSGLSQQIEIYATISTFSIALLFVRIMQYFTFSKKLSAYSEIIAAAAFDIIFFMIMWCVMLIGFAVAFFANFGKSNSQMKTLRDAYLLSLKMSLGQFLYKDMAEDDIYFTTLIFIIFVVIFKILLYNMFIAIISAHYYSFQRTEKEDAEGSGDDDNLLQLIISILRSKLKEYNDKNQEKDQPQESPEDKKKDKHDKKKEKKPKQKYDVKYFEKEFFKYVEKLFKIVDFAEPEEDQDEIDERNKEINDHQRAMIMKVYDPDILDQRTVNRGLIPYIKNINIAKQGEKALKLHFKEKEQMESQQAALQTGAVGAAQLVNANLWLRVLEERIQKISGYSLSLYDFRNHETVYSSLLEDFTLDDLTVIQKQLLKKSSEKDRLDFIKSKMRIYYPDNLSQKSEEESKSDQDGEEQQTKDNQQSQEDMKYKSQIDYIYLMWKALEFEHLYDAVNVEDKDQILKLIEFMNEQTKKAAKEAEEAEKIEDDDDYQRKVWKMKFDQTAKEEEILYKNYGNKEEEKRKKDEKKKSEQEIANDTVIKYQFMVESKVITDRKFNRVTKLQFELWTKELDNYERHCLWFKLFDTMDRVRLWNTLVFSDGYFRLLANSTRFKRNDLRDFFKKNITDKIQESEKELYKSKRTNYIQQRLEGAKKMNADVYEQKGKLIDLKKEPEVMISKEERRKIRDKHYKPDDMLKMWGLIKQRQYECEEQDDVKQESNKDDIENTDRNRKDKGPKKVLKTKYMSEKNLIDMIRSLFKVMIHGVSNDRLNVLMQEALSGGSNFSFPGGGKGLNSFESKNLAEESLKKKRDEHSIDFQIYQRLVEETYDKFSEYRLPLWLPLSLEQKLDMLMHQRLDEEVEMMQFLLDEELGCGQKQNAASLKKYEDVDKMLEKALDSLIFNKYILLTRIQATNTSIKMCNQRINNHHFQDDKLLSYANFLIAQYEQATQYEEKLRKDIKNVQRQNDMLSRKIGYQMKAKRGGQ